MKRDEFEHHISQLLTLLKKILKSQPGANGLNFKNVFDQKHSDPVVFNLCFLNFLSISPEDMEELEEAVSEAFDHSFETIQEADEFHWNQSDIEFLKRYGMKF